VVQTRAELRFSSLLPSFLPSFLPPSLPPSFLPRFELRALRLLRQSLYHLSPGRFWFFSKWPLDWCHLSLVSGLMCRTLWLPPSACAPLIYGMLNDCPDLKGKEHPFQKFLFSFLFTFVLGHRVLLSSHDWLWTYYVAQAGLKLMILLYQSPECTTMSSFPDYFSRLPLGEWYHGSQWAGSQHQPI
jgi:hypothetical protein